MRNAGKIVLAAAAALALGACAPDQEPSSFPPGGGPTYPAPEPAGASASASAGHDTGSAAHECTADDITVTGDFGAKPTITIPDTCSAPTRLLTKDLKPGTGATAHAGSTLQMDYDLVTWSDKVDQQNSFGSAPFSFALGEGTAIPGWDQGLEGIKQGGRRLLVIPPDLGYGARGNGPIKPNETLVFVVDAVQVAG
ncbi:MULTISPECIES: FKBP-type peptidyl-prolyl cis-trans isomerase [Amycolatopsis]|uniref:Peptidyl-prolyl cis-trans isomerase n=1 Tax=Amycolatopsis tucumanensis TaxID=401106 RepID=A0ABP7JCH1_9PSEU|nr:MULTISPECIES: FKBP-type peptidyl-prolyl cis-trans isomerase [Amycolatopsis]MCF6427136.1 FKBP-type peptidyl-prolyl cis-trans isomerase [Amycolatopsis tucumanensis]